MTKQRRMADCHPERIHKAKGLCAACYERSDAKGTRATCHPERTHKAKGLCAACYGRSDAKGTRATCHPERAHQAKGLCAACYVTDWRKSNPEKYAARTIRYADCHPDKAVLALGLCGMCYRRKQRAEKPEYRERERQYGRDYHARHKEDPEYRKRHAQRVRAKRYGLTIEELQALGDSCAVCDSVDNLHVDHCHDTGKVRDILCVNCNTALGRVNDSVERLRALIAYLEEWASSSALSPE